MTVTDNQIHIEAPTVEYDKQNILITNKKCINCKHVSHPNTSVNYCKAPNVFRISIVDWYDACKYYKERESVEDVN